MDTFVHLISWLDRSGYQLPLSCVHWVLAANRAIILGEKVGIKTEAHFRDLVAMRKAGLPLGAANAAQPVLSFIERIYQNVGVRFKSGAANRCQTLLVN